MPWLPELLLGSGTFLARHLEFKQDAGLEPASTSVQEGFEQRAGDKSLPGLVGGDL